MLNVYQMFLILEMGSYDNNNKKKIYFSRKYQLKKNILFLSVFRTNFIVFFFLHNLLYYFFFYNLKKIFFYILFYYSFTIPVKILLVFPHFVVQMLHYQIFFLDHTVIFIFSLFF